jgi:hypothetical protein
MNAPCVVDERVDPRLAFLHRAHARLILFESGLMTLAEAYDGLVDSIQCACNRDMIRRWEWLDLQRPWRRPK